MQLSKSYASYLHKEGVNSFRKVIFQVLEPFGGYCNEGVHHFAEILV
jgi:hypothetical protein